MLSVSPRSSTVPRTPLALMIRPFLPSSILALPSISPMIVSRYDGGLDSRINRFPVFAAYNFTQSGAGNYSIEPSNLFTYVDADGTPKNFHADLEGTIEVNLSGTLAVSRVHDKRASFVSCSSTRKSQLNSAASSAQNYASKAYSYLKSISKSTRRYKTWFGTYTSSRKSTVQSHFRLISSRKYSSFTYDCSCTTSSTYAYVCAYLLRS